MVWFGLVCCIASLRLRLPNFKGLRAPFSVFLKKPSLYREPLRLRVGVTSSQNWIWTRIGKHYHAFSAHAGSCAGPRFSCRLGFTLVPQVFAGCYEPLLKIGLSRRYLCESFPTCLSQYPGGSHGAFSRFFPQDIGLPYILTRSTPDTVRTANSSTEFSSRL